MPLDCGDFEPERQCVDRYQRERHYLVSQPLRVSDCIEQAVDSRSRRKDVWGWGRDCETQPVEDRDSKKAASIVDTAQ